MFKPSFTNELHGIGQNGNHGQLCGVRLALKSAQVLAATTRAPKRQQRARASKDSAVDKAVDSWLDRAVKSNP